MTFHKSPGLTAEINTFTVFWSKFPVANKKHLREFVENTIRTLDYVKSNLESAFGTFYRLGGDGRVYSIDGTNQSAAIYVIGSTTQAIALAWSSGANKIESIYCWDEFSFSKEPDYQLDVPKEGNFSTMLSTIVSMIKSHTMGEVDVDA